MWNVVWQLSTNRIFFFYSDSYKYRNTIAMSFYVTVCLIGNMLRSELMIVL